MQDEISLKLIDTIQIKLTFGEQARLWAGGTENIQTFDMHMRGNECFQCNNEKDNKQAQRFYQVAKKTSIQLSTLCVLTSSECQQVTALMKKILNRAKSEQDTKYMPDAEKLCEAVKFVYKK